ncbi:MAG TPA: hypothetical protein VK176_02485 [Phycisphaerales bacterium]|nr:hypothetical protein [Phycisphaerales bacterium]
MPQVRVVLAAMLAASMLLLSACTNKMAKSLGSLPVAISRSTAIDDRERDEFLAVCRNNPCTCGQEGKPCKEYLVEIYRVDADGSPTTASTDKDWVYRIADVSALDRHFYLGVANPSSQAGITSLKEKRLAITMKLMSIADANGIEYWRRFSGFIEYQRAAKAGSKALMGAGIASTFISPVLGAAIGGAGLTIDAFQEQLTAGFDIEMYTALREAVRAEVLARKAYIRKRLQEPYDSFPATEAADAIRDYAHIYSIRGAVDALKKATTAQTSRATGTTTAPVDGAPADQAPALPVPFPQEQPAQPLPGEAR